MVPARALQLPPSSDKSALIPTPDELNDSTPTGAPEAGGPDFQTRREARVDARMSSTSLPDGAVPNTSFTPFLPLLLLAAALLFWSGFQTVQLINENNVLTAAMSGQETLLQNAGKMRQSLDAIATQTQKLADQGNPNAQLLVAELKRRGITIKANSATAVPPAPGAQ